MTKQHSIILINGSMNEHSLTKKLLQNIADKLKNQANVSIIDVRELQLPVYDPGMEPPDAVLKLSKELKNADGVIAASPEYHGSFTGSMKNLLDFFGAQEFEQKPIGLATVTGGMKSGTNTLNHLRLVFRNLHGNVIPAQFAISQKETTASLKLDEETDLRLVKFVQSFEDEVTKQHLFNEHRRTEPS
ncbi:FMN-dependent NADH-azoreductase [Salipaludibacillus keqinensis]|uniref:FMN-dependent NADH-azoreductase n=1 Tax=Salipaludibacillus keqinensis TaxID=2045207 RepID=A0A323T9M5_9BACI|nr:NAD(P)H-dependent oxidoreductase [Salipaludibacillus keqinensis]PYZ92079.1 FMN-dependent NADH-azoreductase [Salipaludibacillus keqinensis]